MDSFYDVPRNAPTPTNIDKFFITPIVPEVSMVCTAKTPLAEYSTYNTWKNNQQIPKHQSNVLTCNGENRRYDSRPFSSTQQHIQFRSPQNTSQFLKKQVRFESPVLQQRPSLSYEPFITRKKDVQCQNENGIKEKENKAPTTALNDFEKIYMANIPNRQLDLSIVDLPTLSKQKEHKTEKELQKEPNERLDSSCHESVEPDKASDVPKTYRDFLDKKKNIHCENYAINDSVTDIFNYKRNRCLEETKSIPQTNNVSPVYGRNVVVTSNNNCKESFSKKNFDESPLKCFGPAGDTHESEGQRQTRAIHGSPNLRHYRFSEVTPSSNILKQKSNSETQTSACFDRPRLAENTLSKSTDDSEPTTKDLLNIIAKQNEQLLMLQSQVAMLLNRDQYQMKPIENVPQRCNNYAGEKCVTSTQNEYFRQDNNCTPRKRGMSKFSIDLMTSFEVAIRPQHKPNFVNCEPKIQEITESDNATTNKDSGIDNNDKNMYQSLHLKEPVAVQESCPSPEPSININMNDYDSSEDEVSASEISATFYNNLLGQVNNILKKAQIQTRDDIMQKQETKIGTNAANKNRTLNRVRDATLKHLRNIGVTIGPLDESDSAKSSEDDGKNYNPTDVSFAVKQLLMKYLPSDELAKISHKQENSPPCNEKEPGIMTAHPEFSLASVQYMKKYNLIPSNEYKRKCPVNDQKPWKNVHNVQKGNPRILDMTALKMQPKLL